LLSSVKTLNFKENGNNQKYCEAAEVTPFKLDLRVMLDLSAKLPCLESLRCELIDEAWTVNCDSEAVRHYTKDWAGPRRDTRWEFSQALSENYSCLLSSLREIQLDFIDPTTLADGFDQRQVLPNLVKPAMYDPFSSSLRLLSSQLQKLQLRAVVDETLFWPAEGNYPFWPKLEVLDVMFHMATPRGGWYFEGLKGNGRASEGFLVDRSSYPPLGPDERDGVVDDSEESERIGRQWERIQALQFRVFPNNEVLSPFLAAFAKAAANMPSLKMAAVWSVLKYDPREINDSYETHEDTDFSEHPDDELAWGIAYAAPEQQPFPPTFVDGKWLSRPGPMPSRQIWWKVGKWAPDQHIQQLFEQIGMQNDKEKPVEHWYEGASGHGLVHRGLFEHLSWFGYHENTLH
jgi:hypothetical protein